MFGLGFIFKVNDSLELSVIFVPLVLADQAPMVEVVFLFFPSLLLFNSTPVVLTSTLYVCSSLPRR